MTGIKSEKFVVAVGKKVIDDKLDHPLSVYEIEKYER